MEDILNSLINFTAKFLPMAIPAESRILVAEITLALFFAGFLFSYLFNFIVKTLLEIFKKWIKEKRRQKRLAHQKIPGTKYLGEITQYLNRLNVAVIKVNKGSLKMGEHILIKGKLNHSNFQVTSIQINKKAVPIVKKGREAGIIVPEEVKTGDLVYKIKKR